MSEDRGRHVRSGWGEGNHLSEYAPGDIVYIPHTCPGVLDDRCLPGLARVISVFSIDDGPSFYYRTTSLTVAYANGYRLREDGREECSDRIHVIRDHSSGAPDVDYTAGWVLLYDHPNTEGIA